MWPKTYIIGNNNGYDKWVDDLFKLKDSNIHKI